MVVVMEVYTYRERHPVEWDPPAKQIQVVVVVVVLRRTIPLFLEVLVVQE